MSYCEHRTLHMEDVGVEINSYICPVCGKAFKVEELPDEEG